MVVGLTLAPLGVSLAQDTTVVTKDTTVVTPPPQAPAAVDHLRCGFCHRPNVPMAIFEGFLVNGVVNRFNAWVLKDSLFYVTPHSWNVNLTLTIHSTYYDRLSKYADGTRNRRNFPEVRVFAAYKTAHKAVSAQ
jgi:hypothetical protein